MEFDPRLLALIRRAAPTPSAMIELIAAMLDDFTPDQRHEVFASLNASGFLGEPFTDPWVIGGSLSHAAEVDILDVSRGLSTEAKDRLLTQIGSRSPVETWIAIDERASDIETQMLRSMHMTNRLLVVLVGDRRLAPPFQFERDATTLLPRFLVQRTNRILHAAQDPWGALSWWTSSNGWLEGRSPSDLVGTPDEGIVLQLAESVLAG